MDRKFSYYNKKTGDINELRFFQGSSDRSGDIAVNIDQKNLIMSSDVKKQRSVALEVSALGECSADIAGALYGILKGERPSELNELQLGHKTRVDGSKLSGCEKAYLTAKKTKYGLDIKAVGPVFPNASRVINTIEMYAMSKKTKSFFDKDLAKVLLLSDADLQILSGLLLLPPLPKK